MGQVKLPDQVTHACMRQRLDHARLHQFVPWQLPVQAGRCCESCCCRGLLGLLGRLCATPRSFRNPLCAGTCLVHPPQVTRHVTVSIEPQNTATEMTSIGTSRELLPAWSNPAHLGMMYYGCLPAPRHIKSLAFDLRAQRKVTQNGCRQLYQTAHAQDLGPCRPISPSS